jgi:hypothetical protein
MSDVYFWVLELLDVMLLAFLWSVTQCCADPNFLLNYNI